MALLTDWPPLTDRMQLKSYKLFLLAVSIQLNHADTGRERRDLRLRLRLRIPQISPSLGVFVYRSSAKVGLILHLTALNALSSHPEKTSKFLERGRDTHQRHENLRL